MNKKVALAILLMICIIIIPINSFAEGSDRNQVLTISLEDAYKRALDTNEELKRNDKRIYDLTKPYGATAIIHNRSQYSMEKEFQRLYEKLLSGKFLQSYEQGELVMYYAAFKDSEIFKDKTLSPTIYPNEFPNCDIWVNMIQMKISNELIRANLKDSVRQLYDSLIGINDIIDIMDESNKVTEIESKEAIKNFANGKISELQKTKILSNYEIQKISLIKQKRTKENIERNLKKALGIDLNTEIHITPYEVSEKDIIMPSYESCLKKATLHRNEITLTKMNLQAAKIQLPIVEDYNIYVPEIEEFKMQKQEILLRIDELNDEIKMQEEIVTKNINTLYSDVDYQKKTLDIEKLNLKSAQKGLDKALLQYKAGEIGYKELSNIKITFEKSKSSYQRALRDLAFKISKLNHSCEVG